MAKQIDFPNMGGGPHQTCWRSEENPTLIKTEFFGFFFFAESTSRLYIVSLFIQRLCNKHVRCWAGRITGWNQDCQEKYQQPQICRWYYSNGRKQRGTKEPHDEGEKAGLKPSIQKTKIMASSPITSKQIDGEKVETVADFIFLGSKITADGDCSHEIKRRFLGKARTNLDSALKSRDITLLTKVSLVKAVVFPVVMYGCESWTIKKAEHWRIDAFQLGCWRRLLRVPWTARRSNQSIWKKINPEYLLEGLRPKLKL